jgi:hypothetical protein
MLVDEFDQGIVRMIRDYLSDPSRPFFWNMHNDPENKAVKFFETQFQRQVREQEYALNPFEIRALDYVKG